MLSLAHRAAEVTWLAAYPCRAWCIDLVEITTRCHQDRQSASRIQRTSETPLPKSGYSHVLQQACLRAFILIHKEWNSVIRDIFEEYSSGTKRYTSFYRTCLDDHRVEYYPREPRRNRHAAACSGGGFGRIYAREKADATTGILAGLSRSSDVRRQWVWSPSIEGYCLRSG